MVIVKFLGEEFFMGNILGMRKFFFGLTEVAGIACQIKLLANSSDCVQDICLC